MNREETIRIIKLKAEKMREQDFQVEEIADEDLFDAYVEEFQEFPPVVPTIDTNNKTYINLLKKAITIKQPLTFKDIDIALEDQQYDNYRETDEDIYNEAIRKQIEV